MFLYILFVYHSDTSGKLLLVDSAHLPSRRVHTLLKKRKIHPSTSHDDLSNSVATPQVSSANSGGGGGGSGSGGVENGGHIIIPIDPKVIQVVP